MPVHKRTAQGTQFPLSDSCLEEGSKSVTLSFIDLCYTHDMILGYVRVSTADQSLARQTDELTAAGCEKVYTDVASGKKGSDRPQWSEMLRALRQGDSLVVTELSRLGRSTSQLSALADELRERGVSLRILNLGIDTSTPAGKLVYGIIAAVAEMERDLLIKRTHSGLTAARARGRSGGRKREFSEANVRKAQRLYNEAGLSMTDVARTMGVSRQTLYRYLDTTAS